MYPHPPGKRGGAERGGISKAEEAEFSEGQGEQNSQKELDF